MKWFDIILNGSSRLPDVLRAAFSVPGSPDNDLRCQRERRNNSERRRAQRPVYLQGTDDGGERRCSHGRRSGDPCSPVSFIGVFLRQDLSREKDRSGSAWAQESG
ncbi:hypothetical protein EDC23_1628 [Thiohalophilus thiocyanatoxydans]|uniref:Uncharacterized protein n=1 Tax=Thiohalophilus thiocyanatoxydans TaxID=381308 RepID=A0A4R8IVE4_9GAMM|nr:hypothetical protein EDC23_1628 [Thiohalophilus thiocyanatoxydans]